MAGPAGAGAAQPGSELVCRGAGRRCARPDGELQRPPAALGGRERWQLTVRLKAPHGASNPFGFDYELWLWEQGVQATGYVRAGPKDPAPQRLGQTGQHPVEWARQQVRNQIFERVAERPYAGLIAALVVGDQKAIERVDWDVFRATGVAHLMSISGLHITMFAWVAAWGLGWPGAVLGACVCGARPPARPWSVACCWPRLMPLSAAGACQRSARC